MSVPVPLLTAVTGRWEAPLVAGLAGCDGVQVVRRCADLADLLAAAASGLGRAAVVSADLRSLDGDALTRLDLAGVATVALVEPGDDAAARRLRQLGVGQVLPSDAPAEQVAQAVLSEVAPDAPVEAAGAGRVSRGDGPPVREQGTSGTSHPTSAQGDAGRRPPASTAYGDPRAALPADPPTDSTANVPGQRPGRVRDPLAGLGSPDQPVRSGRVIAVWGPAGAPGRTTTSVGLAAEVAGSGSSCLLVDADTYAASVAQVLGLLDEAPGLASAARAADHGRLDVAALSALAPQVLPGLRVLTGLSSAARWPEIRPASFAAVLRVARGLTRDVVVDVGSSLEQDEELSYDTAAPRRNGVTLQALQDADTVVAVGSADPVGLQRLVRGLQELAAVISATPVVVVNRVRASAVGPGPERAVRRALARYAGVDDPVLVPYDGPGLDAAVLQGRTVSEAAPSSPVRAAHARLAARLGIVAAASRPAVRSGRWAWARAGA